MARPGPHHPHARHEPDMSQTRATRGMHTKRGRLRAMRFPINIRRRTLWLGVGLSAALLLLSVAALGAALPHRAQAVACGIYQVGAPASGSRSLANYTVYLMCNSCTGDNFSLARVPVTQFTTAPNIQVDVFRNAQGTVGADGATEGCGDIEHGFCGSPPVHSPNNPAYACVTDWSVPSIFHLCTAAY